MPKITTDDDSLPPRGAAEPQTPPAEPEVKLPKQIKVTHYYAYYEENGRYRAWNAGDVITSADEIKLLVQRGAPYVEE